MTKQMNTIDDFLKDRTNAGGGGGKYLKWREKDAESKVRVWLHCEAPIYKVWRHGGIPRIVTLTDRETDEQVTKLWPGFHVCHEGEEVLDKQYKRDRATGERVAYPKRCPLCRLAETVREMVDAGQLSWTAPVFKFETDDPNAKTPRIVLHAGGLYNAFGRKDLDEGELREMKRAGISQQTAWGENIQAKAGYLFLVVNNEAPEDGVQIAFEGGALGDAVRDVLDDARESLGREAGDPRLHPFALMWKHMPKEKIFSNKYRALRLEKLDPTEDVLELLRGPAPDVSRDIKPFNVHEMRGVLEKHALVKLPWDEIFDVPAAKEKPRDDEEGEERPRGRGNGAQARREPKEGGEERPPPKREDAPAQRRRAPVKPQAEIVECDACGKPMPEDAAECPHCGEKYGPAPAKADAPAPRPKAPPPPKSSAAPIDDDDADGGVGF